MISETRVANVNQGIPSRDEYQSHPKPKAADPRNTNLRAQSSRNVLSEIRRRSDCKNTAQVSDIQGQAAPRVPAARTESVTSRLESEQRIRLFRGGAETGGARSGARSTVNRLLSRARTETDERAGCNVAKTLAKTARRGRPVVRKRLESPSVRSHFSRRPSERDSQKRGVGRAAAAAEARIATAFSSRPADVKC